MFQEVLTGSLKGLCVLAYRLASEPAPRFSASPSREGRRNQNRIRCRRHTPRAAPGMIAQRPGATADWPLCPIIIGKNKIRNIHRTFTQNRRNSHHFHRLIRQNSNFAEFPKSENPDLSMLFAVCIIIPAYELPDFHFRAGYICGLEHQSKAPSPTPSVIILSSRASTLIAGLSKYPPFFGCLRANIEIVAAFGLLFAFCKNQSSR